MDGHRDDHINWSKSLSKKERQIPYDITYVYNLIHDTNELNYEKETDSWTERTDLWLPREVVWQGCGLEIWD